MDHHTAPPAGARTVDRDILRLAVPALGALIAEPLFLLADTAMVGHLGATPLAGLGIANFKLVPVSLAPLGKEIVDKA